MTSIRQTTRRRWARGSAMAVAGVASVAMLTACQEQAPGTQEPTHENAMAAQDGGGFVPASNSGTSGDALTKDTFVSTISQQVDNAGDVTADVKVAGEKSATVDLDLSGEKPSARMTLDNYAGMDVNGEALMVDDKLYVKGSAMGFSTEGKYVEIDPAMLGGDTSDVVFGQQEFFLVWGASVKDVSKATKVEDDGQTLYRYTVTSQIPEEALKEMDPEISEQELKALEGEDLSTYQVDVDSNGLPHRVLMGEGAEQVEIDFTTWGQNYTFKAPSADQTTDLGSLFGGLGSELEKYFEDSGAHGHHESTSDSWSYFG